MAQIKFELRRQTAADLEEATGPGSWISSVSGEPVVEHFGANQKRNFDTYSEAKAWLVNAFIRNASVFPYTPSPLPRFLEDDELGFVEISFQSTIQR